MLKNKANNKKGFTLAELLIVVAIIGILVAISMPILTSRLNELLGLYKQTLQIHRQP